MTADSDPFQLYGTRETETPPVRLSAGKLTTDFKDGNLRSIRYGAAEVLRAVSYLVRDRDWGTYAPTIRDLRIDQREDGFSVRYVAHCTGPQDTALAIDVQITAEAGEALIFSAEALSATGFETNRCGFCILHPIIGVAGMPTSIEHVDGNRIDTHFPDLIEPWQPFKDMRAITHSVTPYVTAECRMEGDTFEMEDQRNWSDASYKTYVRPLALPWPYRIPAGEPIRQRIILSVGDMQHSVAASATIAAQRSITLSPGEKSGTMPAIGLVITPEEAEATLAAHSRLAEIAPQELLFHFDPDAAHGADAFNSFAAISAVHAGRSTLEIVLPCRVSPLAEVQHIATLMRGACFKPDAIIISPAVDRQSTPPGSKWPECPPLEEIYAAAHTAFPGIRIGGGLPIRSASSLTAPTRSSMPQTISASCRHWRRSRSSRGRCVPSTATSLAVSVLRPYRCGRTPMAAGRWTIHTANASPWPIAIRGTMAASVQPLRLAMPQASSMPDWNV